MRDHLNFSRIKRGGKFALLCMLIFLIVNGCHKLEEPTTEVRGTLIESSFIATYPSSFISNLLDIAGVDLKLDLHFTVNAVKAIYYTEGQNGDLVKASGVFLVPQTLDELPILSIQHGTETKREQVASVNPTITGEGLVGMVTASLGFATCLPDYLGLGESVMMHPYLLAKPSADASIDLLRAYKSYLNQTGINLNGDIYLGGYSEGGYVTLSLLKEIEMDYSSEFHVTACAPMAGPYDLDATIRKIIGEDSYEEPTFIAYFLTAYNDYYGWNRLDEIFQSPYAGSMESLFDGSQTTTEINNQLTNILSDLVRDDFKNGYLNGTDDQMVNAVKENTLLGWKPTAPIRFYHSNGDEIVPYQNALSVMEDFTANGATDISLVTIDSLQHAKAALPAYIKMVEWFDSLRTL